MRARSFSLLLNFSLGCVPLPFYKYSRPEVDGTLLDIKVAKSKIMVWYGESIAKKCSSPPENAAMTDADGKFSLSAEKSLSYWFPLLPVHCGENWKICFRTIEGAYFERSFGFYGTCTGAPNKMEVLCSLDKQKENCQAKLPQ